MFFLISLNLLKMHGMKDLSTNYIPMEFVEKNVKNGNAKGDQKHQNSFVRF